MTDSSAPVMGEWTSSPARKQSFHGAEETLELGTFFVQFKIFCKSINFSYYLSPPSTAIRDSLFVTIYWDLVCQVLTTVACNNRVA